MSNPATADRHVHELDIVRILTFACVIGVHTISNTNVGSNPVSNAVELLLHFTREAFFFLTGFVLMHQYGSRRFDLARFYRRRLLLVGGPYLAWTLIYTFWKPVAAGGSWSRQVHELPGYIVYGSAWYHLYFLLVSLQIYLLFPLISRLVNRTRRHHLALLVISGALELALLTWVRYDSRPTPSALFNGHQDIWIWNYQFWILLGAIAACHRSEVAGWIRRHRPLVAGLVGLGAGLALAWYCGELAHGLAPISAAVVLQPIMVPWSLAAIAGLFAIGTSWTDRRTGGVEGGRPVRLQAAVDYASDRSFGIFLVHPLVLSALLGVGHGTVPRHVGNPGLTVLSYVVVIVGAVVVTEVARRSPLSLILTGRPQVRHRRQPNPKRTVESTPRTESVSPIG